MENKTMYLVSYVGIYPGDMGDHSVCLFDSYEKAKKCFKKSVRECRKYYRDELNAAYEEYSDEQGEWYRLETDRYEDFVDIWIQEIKCDGKLNTFAF